MYSQQEKEKKKGKRKKDREKEKGKSRISNTSFPLNYLLPSTQDYIN